MKKQSLVRADIAAIDGYAPGEQPRDRKYIKLNTNENPYPFSPAVTKAIGKCLERARLYPDPNFTELRKTAAKIYRVRPEQILVGNGSDDCLTILTRTILGRGDIAAFPKPTYTLYRTLCQLQGCKYKEVPFPENFDLPAKDLLATKAKLFFFANPNSPTSTQVSAKTIEAFAKKTSGVVVVDEAYADFATENCLGLIRKGLPNVLLLRTFSKSYSLAGMRVGLALGPEVLIQELYKMKDSYNVNVLSQAAATAALLDQKHLKNNTAKIQATRKRLTRELEKRGFTVLPSQSNFLLARPADGCGKELYLKLKDNGILVRWFSPPELREWVRISIGSDAEINRLLTVIG